MTHFSPSILSADFVDLKGAIDAVKKGGSDYLHVDVMDGVFVPSISMGLPVLKSIEEYTDMFLDVHLMIIEPERYIEDFMVAGADLITFHYEAAKDIMGTITAIKKMGIKVGLAINPETPAEVLKPYLASIDMAVIMTVRPGFGGQIFREDCADKINKVAGWIKERDLKTDIEVDGGVKLSNVSKVLDRGANVIVAGSAVFKNDIVANTKNFINILNEYDIKRK